jgi:uroporphyrinogen decarboxylase
MGRLSEAAGHYLVAQARAGAHVLQLFDSWVGDLSAADYLTYVFPYTKRTLQIARTAGVPIIHFGVNNGHLVELMRDAGSDVIGVDWRVDLGVTWERIGYDHAIQGNLDPISLFADPDTLMSRAQQVLDQAGGRPGHIFNLGHGVLPDTSPDQVKRLVDFVHTASLQRG